MTDIAEPQSHGYEGIPPSSGDGSGLHAAGVNYIPSTPLPTWIPYGSWPHHWHYATGSFTPGSGGTQEMPPGGSATHQPQRQPPIMMDAATLINNLSYINRMQACELSSCNSYHSALAQRLVASEEYIDRQQKQIKAWESKTESLQQWEARKDNFEAVHTAQIKSLERDLADHKSDFEQVSMVQSTVKELKGMIANMTKEITGLKEQQAITVVDKGNQAVLIERLESKIDQLDNELTESKQNVNGMKHDHKEEMSTLASELADIYDGLKNLEEYQLTSDPVCLMRIRIRSLMDRVMAILYTVLTGNPPDPRLILVKAWWARLLNPPSSKRASMDQKGLDEYRFNQAVGALFSAGLASKPVYQQLINSGTLRFFTQSYILLRDQANVHAHELMDVKEFRKALEEVKSQYENLCSADDFSHIHGLVNFVEAMQSKV